MTSEKTIRLAAKLYDARDTMRRFWGDQYAEKMTECQGWIRKLARASHCDEMKATMELVKRFQARVPDSGMTQALVLAAYVEMTEPSK